MEGAATARVHGAVSLVNALAAGRGATVGVASTVEADVRASPGSGITVRSENRSLSSRLVALTVQKMAPARALARTAVRVELRSEIPTGFGLKSSSAISSVVALACARAFGDAGGGKEKGAAADSRVLAAGVDASIETGVSVTGAYDDACACYYGGIAVTDNGRRRLVASARAPRNLAAAIFVPRSRRRGRAADLRLLRPVFERAWALAREGHYWDAMTVNGLAAAPMLGPDPRVLADLVGAGALGASVSGNGPAVAAVARRGDMPEVEKVLSRLDGRTVVAALNNERARVADM